VTRGEKRVAAASVKRTKKTAPKRTDQQACTLQFGEIISAGEAFD
jgi:hypothetical protein